MRKAVWLLCIILLNLSLVFAADFPTKPITYVICFDPGGESDITARIQQPYLEKVLGVPVVITYKPGGGGATGWSELVNRATPDGYSVYGTNLPHIILQPIQGGVPYKTEQIENIYFFQTTPCTLVVPIDSPIKSFDDFLKMAKGKKSVLIGGSGQPSANSFATLRLAKVAGLNLTYIPFTGTGTAVPALLGGNVDALMTYTTVSVQYKDKLRTIAVATEQRVPFLPDVPTFREFGYDVVEKAFRGVAVPPGTPAEIKRILGAAFAEVNKNPEVRSKMEELGFVLEDYNEAQAKELVAKLIPYYKELWDETQKMGK